VTTPSPAAAVQDALARAGALVDDRQADAHDAADLIRDAWATLFLTVRGQPLDAAAPEADVGAWARDRVRRRFGDLDGEESRPLRWLFADADRDPEARPPAEPSREELRAHLSLLAALANEDLARHDGAPIAGLVMVVALLLVAFLAPMFPSFGEGDGTWRGRYYASEDFSGEAIEEYAHRIEFDWQRDPPRSGIPKDSFSVRWDTCLVVEDETKLRFTVTSDDGSRVLVDDETIVDNWGTHAKRARSGSVTLDEGSHHVVVEYFEARFAASIELTAAFGSGKSEQLPSDMLRQPSEDDDAPCQ